MLIFNNNKPIKQKRWINTKVEFIWDGSQYVEQSAEGYWYDGEMALCQINDESADGNDWGWRFINTYGGDSMVYLSHADNHGMHINVDAAAADTYLVRMISDNGLSPIDKFIVKGDGNVGIGTYTPCASGEFGLDLTTDTTNGTRLYLENTSAGGAEWLLISTGTANGEGAGNLMFTKDGAAKVSFDSDGSVGIGTTSPGYNLEVAGTFYSAGSSIDYKKHVTDLEVDSSLIHSLRPVSYNYKKEYKDFGYNVKEGKQIGLVSEEVAETIPELAIMKDGKPKNVDYQKLAVILLKEVQNLKKEVEELKVK